MTLPATDSASPDFDPAARGPSRTEGNRVEHELRNYLYLTISFAQLLEGTGPLTATQADCLRQLLQCAEAMRGLLDRRAAANPPHAEAAHGADFMVTARSGNKNPA